MKRLIKKKKKKFKNKKFTELLQGTLCYMDAN